MPQKPSPPEYVLGRSEQESQRLIKQAIFLRPSTERVFRKAGIIEGMRVLDMGCGAGDVSFLAAELVGRKGMVVGVDQNPEVLELARRRADESGFAQVTFEEGEISEFTTTAQFDAVVGRFVLMYQADPVATLAHVFGLLAPGGLLVVQEPDFQVGVATRPTVQLWQQVNYWIGETFRRGGVHHDIGGRLYHVFRLARLPGPAMLEHVSVGGGAGMRPFYENSAELVLSLLPRMEQFDVADAQEVQADTLANRLEDATCRAECQLTYVPLVAAWTVK